LSGVDTLFINLDRALYQAKHLGKNCVAIYSEASQETAQKPLPPRYITPQEVPSFRPKVQDAE